MLVLLEQVEMEYKYQLPELQHFMPAVVEVEEMLMLPEELVVVDTERLVQQMLVQLTQVQVGVEHKQLVVLEVQEL